VLLTQPPRIRSSLWSTQTRFQHTNTHSQQPAPIMATTASAPTRQTSGRLTNLAEKTTEVAQTTYSTAKGFVPEKLRPTVANVESQVAATTAPYVHKAQDAGRGCWEGRRCRSRGHSILSPVTSLRWRALAAAAQCGPRGTTDRTTGSRTASQTWPLRLPRPCLKLTAAPALPPPPLPPPTTTRRHAAARGGRQG
jgi:hypothetical protein